MRLTLRNRKTGKRITLAKRKPRKVRKTQYA